MPDIIDDILEGAGLAKPKPSKLDRLDPDFRSKFEQLEGWAKQNNISLKVREGYRSKETQDGYYAQGRSKPGNIITYAKGGQSDHQYGQAIDVDPSDGDYRKLGAQAKKLGLKWGGDWKDFKDWGHIYQDDIRKGRKKAVSESDVADQMLAGLQETDLADDMLAGIGPTTKEPIANIPSLPVPTKTPVTDVVKEAVGGILDQQTDHLQHIGYESAMGNKAMTEEEFAKPFDPRVEASATVGAPQQPQTPQRAQPQAQPQAAPQQERPAPTEDQPVYVDIEWGGGREGALDSAATRLANRTGIDQDIVRDYLDKKGFAEGELTEERAERGQKKREQVQVGLDMNAIKELQGVQYDRKKRKRLYDEALVTAEGESDKIKQLNALIASGSIDPEKGRALIEEERQAFSEAEKALGTNQSLAGIDQIRFGVSDKPLKAGTPNKFSQREIDEIVKEHGGFAEKAKRDAEIEKKYGTLFNSVRPLARPTEAVLNIARYALKIPSTVSTALGMGADAVSPFGAPDNPFNQFADDWTKRVDSSENKDFKGEIMVDLLPKAAAQLGTQAVLTATTGLGGLLLPLAEGATSQYNEARKGGAGKNTRLLAGTIGGLAAVPGTILHAKYLKGLLPAQQKAFVDNLTKEALKRFSKFLPEAEARQATTSFVGSFVKKAGIGAGLEPTQEYSEDVINETVKKLTYDPSVTWEDVFIPSEGRKKGYIVASILGGAGGTIETFSRMPDAELQRTNQVVEDAIKQGIISKEDGKEVSAAAFAEAKKRNITLQPEAQPEQVSQSSAPMETKALVSDKPVEKRDVEKVQEVDEWWQNTVSEMKAANPHLTDLFWKQIGNSSHRVRVRNAIADGKPVPQKVVDEYPGIREEADQQRRRADADAKSRQERETRSSEQAEQAKERKLADDAERERQNTEDGEARQVTAFERKISTPLPQLIADSGYKTNRQGVHDLIRHEQEEAIRKALSEGRDIPAEVLKDYPELTGGDVRASKVIPSKSTGIEPTSKTGELESTGKSTGKVNVPITEIGQKTVPITTGERRTRMTVEAPIRPETLEGAKNRIKEVEEQRDTAKREAETDSLTGLANRTAFNKALPTAEADKNTSIIAFDANNFGSVNKIAGQEEGDRALVEVANAIKQAAEESGNTRYFRRGGDEFVVLADNKVADKIRARAEEIYGEKDYQGVKVSVSGTVGKTFKDADSQLQDAKAKRKGAKPVPTSVGGKVGQSETELAQQYDDLGGQLRKIELGLTFRDFIDRKDNPYNDFLAESVPNWFPAEIKEHNRIYKERNAVATRLNAISDKKQAEAGLQDAKKARKAVDAKVVAPKIEKAKPKASRRTIVIPNTDRKKYAAMGLTEAEVQEQVGSPEFQRAEATSKTQKVDKNGFTPAQKVYLAKQLEQYIKEYPKDAPYAADSIDIVEKDRERSEKPRPFSSIGFKLATPQGFISSKRATEIDRETIIVPDDGTFTVTDLQQANRLYQRITGKPIKGQPKERLQTRPAQSSLPSASKGARVSVETALDRADNDYEFDADIPIEDAKLDPSPKLDDKQDSPNVGTGWMSTSVQGKKAWTNGHILIVGDASPGTGTTIKSPDADKIIKLAKAQNPEPVKPVAVTNRGRIGAVVEFDNGEIVQFKYYQLLKAYHPNVTFKQGVDNKDPKYPRAGMILALDGKDVVGVISPLHSTRQEAADRVAKRTDEPLKKVRDTESSDLLTKTLPNAHEQDVLEGITSKIQGNDLELNEFASEAVRRLMGNRAEKQGKAKDETEFEGIVLSADQLREIAQTGRDLLPEYKKVGYTDGQLKAFVELFDNLEQLADINQDYGIMYVFDDALPEEQVHQEDLRAGRTTVAALAKLKQSPIWKNPGGTFRSQYPKISDANKASEIAAKLATGQAERYGWDKFTEQDRNDFLSTWADGIVDNNEELIKSEGFEAFAQKFARIAQYATLEKSNAGAATESEGDASATEPVGEVGQEKGTDESKKADEVRSGAAEREVGQKKASFSRILGQDYYYDPQSHEQTEQKAAQLQGRVGTAEAVNQALHGTPSAEGMRVVYWELERLNGLADAYLKSDEVEKFNAVATEAAELSAQIVQRQVAAGQEIEIAKVLAPLSPEVAILTATKMVKYSRGEDAQLTTKQTETVIKIANELKEANSELAKANDELAKARRRIKRLEDDREPRKRSTTQTKLLTEYKKNEKDILAKLRQAFPNSPMFNGEEEALRSVPSQPKPTNTDNFRKWFGNSKVVDENGEPLVVYHGTTHDFDTFDPERANIENHFGKAIYLTDSPTDVAENYAGAGPDLTQRIEIRAERIFQEDEKEYKYGTPAYERAMAKAREIAKKEIAGPSEGLTMPLYAKIENPAYIGVDGKKSWIEGLEQFEENEPEQYDADYNETQEWTDWNQRREEFEEEQLDREPPLYEAIQKASYQYNDIDTQKIFEDVGDLVYDSLTADDLDTKLRESEGAMYATDDNGDLASHDFIKEVFRNLGFDGIIMDADSTFGSGRTVGKQMEMDYGTKHYHVFEPTQIKSAIGNRGTFDPNEDSILKSVAQSPLDEDTKNLLTDYAIGQILTGRSYKTVIETLGEISGATANEIKAIHAKAVDTIRPAKEPKAEEEKAKLRLRNEHYKEADAFASPDKVAQKKRDAALRLTKARLEREIETITKEIETRERTKKGTAPTSPEIEALKTRRKELAKQKAEVFGTDEMKERDRIELAKKHLEKSIKDLEARIKAKDIRHKAKPTAKVADEIKDLRDERQRLADELDKLKDAARTYDKPLKPGLSGIAQDALEKYPNEPDLILAIDRLTGVRPKSINEVIKDVRDEMKKTMEESVAIVRRANKVVRELKAERAKEAAKERGLTDDLVKEQNEARVRKAQATYRLNKFLSQLTDRPNVMQRFNNDFRAKLVSNWGTQLFNVVQSVTVSTPAEMMLDLLETGIKAVGLRIGETPDINAKDVLLPYAYIASNNKQLAEFALSEFPEEYFKVHSGLLGDIEIEPLKMAPEAGLTKPFHWWFDKNQVLNDKLAKLSGAKMQEMHFRNALVAATFDQIIRRKSDETLESAIKKGTLKDYITEKDAKFAADRALRVTFAAMIDDKAGKMLKRAYDQLDKVLPVFLNPVTFARFTYTTTRVMVANPILFGALDSKVLGGAGYDTRSIAKGILGWSGIATAYGLMSALGGDDDKWETLYVFGKDNPPLDIRRFFPLSAYFYMAHIIKGQVEGRPNPTGKELLEGFASLESDYFTYGAGMEFAGTAIDKAMGTKEWSDVGGSSARLLGSYLSGILRFVKPMKDTLAQFDSTEAGMREYSDSAGDKFIKEVSKTLPFISRASNAAIRKDVDGKDVLTPFPMGRMIGMNIVHPTFLNPKDSVATEWANRLFPNEFTGGEFTAEDRKAYQARKMLKNAARSGKKIDFEAKIADLEKTGVLTKRSADLLRKDIQLSELQSLIKTRFTVNEKDIKALRRVWAKATDKEKNEIRDVLIKKRNRTAEFNAEFGLGAVKLKSDSPDGKALSDEEYGALLDEVSGVKGSAIDPTVSKKKLNYGQSQNVIDRRKGVGLTQEMESALWDKLEHQSFPFPKTRR
jgi:diguanylate cyclase (GGDEF)-like protein